jgi:alpha-mannosidase
MSVRELILLTPYQFPAKNSLMLGNEEVSALLNAHAALWHPAALVGAAGPPGLSSPTDHEQPSTGQLFAIPESPPLALPDDWGERVRGTGAISFRSSPDRTATFSNLFTALRDQGDKSSKVSRLLELGEKQTAPFRALGFGYRMIESLSEAMEHESALSTTDFWLDIQSAITAIADLEESRKHLQAAADRLLEAREILYPSNIFLIEIALLDDKLLAESLPNSIESGTASNLISAAMLLEELGRRDPARLAALREGVSSGLLEICGGPYVEREDPLLPLESQLWNLLRGLRKYKELLGQDIQIFARKRFGAHPALPLLLSQVGLKRAVLLAFDDSVLPSFRATVVNWPSPDGKQVDAFTRVPYAADSPQTFFHWAHYLHQTIAQDHSATLALLHRGSSAAPGYEELLELTRLGPVIGQWKTFSQYFSDVMAGEYASAPSADEFQGDYLTERTETHVANPITSFAQHVRSRRRLDTARTWVALYRGLVGGGDESSMGRRLDSLEDAVESQLGESKNALVEIEDEAARMLGQRLLARAPDMNPGFLVLNPCSFGRRAVVELRGVSGPLVLDGPLKTSQREGETTWAVVEVPAWGFAWLPQEAPPGTPPASPRMRMTDVNMVRNEFFEAEIDRETGGLRALRDHRTRVNRIGQQLIFNPGSRMRAKEIRITSQGPALGEIVSEGELIDDHGSVLARFQQHFRAWLGRPVLDLKIDIRPERALSGYPWHAYYGARFAWREERAALFRGVNGASFVTNHTRPQTADYVELRLGRDTTTLFVEGLPFHQRQGRRMLDVILLVEGQAEHFFDLALGLDRENPAQTALGLISPVTVVPTAKGPPPGGAVGWLFHLDAPNLLLTRMWADPSGGDAVCFRLLECQNRFVQAELRCARNPRRASLIDALGNPLQDVTVSGDAVQFEVSSGDLVQLRVDFD